MLITYPLLLPLTDDNGVLLTAPTVTITSVKDKSGNTIASPGATVNVSGANASVDYDAEAHGEAWITLAVSQSGSSVSNANASPVIYASRDAGRIQSGISAAGQVAASNLPTDYQQRGVAVVLPSGEDSSIQADVTAALTAQGVTAARAAKLDNLDAAVSSRSTFAGGNVTVGGYASGQDPAALLLTVPANKLSTDASGKVGANNLPTLPTNFAALSITASGAVTAGTVGDKAGYTVSTVLDKAGYTVSTVLDKAGYSAAATNLPADYQQRGIAVTLPSTAPTGYGGSGAPTVAQIAAGILSNPTQPILTNASGYVTTSNPATGGSAVTEATIWAYASRALTDKTGFSGTATNLPADYQQRGVAVTLPASVPAGYAAPSVAAIASAVQALFPAEYLSTAEISELSTTIADLNSLLGRTDTASAVSAISSLVAAIKAKTDALALDVSGHVTTANPTVTVHVGA